MKKTVISAFAIVALLITSAFLGFYNTPSKTEEESPYSLTEENYEADTWYETLEYDGYTVTKHMTMGSPSVIVEYYEGQVPVSVTITRGSKTTLVYTPDYLSYDMYISYRNDAYIIKDEFSNLDDIVSYAFDWSADSYLGTYYEEYITDESGNIVYTDEDGNTVVYRYEDEIE